MVACHRGVVTSRVKVPLWFRKGDEIDGGVANLLLIKDPLNDSDLYNKVNGKVVTLFFD